MVKNRLFLKYGGTVDFFTEFILLILFFLSFFFPLSWCMDGYSKAHFNLPCGISRMCLLCLLRCCLWDPWAGPCCKVLAQWKVGIHWSSLRDPPLRTQKNICEDYMKLEAMEWGWIFKLYSSTDNIYIMLNDSCCIFSSKTGNTSSVTGRVCSFLSGDRKQEYGGTWTLK